MKLGKKKEDCKNRTGKVISFLIILSSTINIFLVWYLYRFFVRYSDLVSLVEDLQYKIFYFSKHLQGLYELETYYGEPTIQNLIEHSKILLSSFDEFNDDYISFEGEEEYERLQEEVEK